MALKGADWALERADWALERADLAMERADLALEWAHLWYFPCAKSALSETGETEKVNFFRDF